MSENAPKHKANLDEIAVPLTEHLRELRKRIIICCWAIGIGFVASYGFSKQIFDILMLPLAEAMPEKSSMIFTGLTEGFFTYLKVALLSGVLIATPVIFYQMWAFISPGLYSHEKKYIFPFTLFSVIFFVGGALFGYFAVFPFAFKFFMGFSTDQITALPSMREFLKFSTKLLMAFGLAFELPVFLVILSKMGVITTEQLKKNRKYVLVLAFIAAAILTPPDIVTQIMMAIPLMILYELSIIGTRIFGKKKKKHIQ